MAYTTPREIRDGIEALSHLNAVVLWLTYVTGSSRYQ